MSIKVCPCQTPIGSHLVTSDLTDPESAKSEVFEACVNAFGKQKVVTIFQGKSPTVFIGPDEAHALISKGAEAIDMTEMQVICDNYTTANS